MMAAQHAPPGGANPAASASTNPGMFSFVRQDFLASIVVFLVALPLCIGIAVAVGVSPARALITGIVGGIVVGFLAGSPLQVSGPAAGLFVIVADLISKHKAQYLAAADPSMSESARNAAAMDYALVVLGTAVLLSGVLQFVAGSLRVGQWFRAVSPAVIKGMLAGIGVLIFASQFHVMLDHVPMYQGSVAEGGVQYLATIPEAVWKCLSPDTGQMHHLAAATGLLTIAVILLWQKFAPRRLKLLPGALVAVLAATAFATLAGLDVIRLEMPANLMTEVTLPSMLSLELMLQSSVLIGAIVLAIVGSAETLLCATAVDQMQNGPRTHYDRELRAQGIGNMICGCLGALPMTGVIVRSAANVEAGARTRLSTILHGIWLLLFVAAIPWVLEFIPKAALGAILVYTGYKLVNIKAIKELWKYGKSEVLIYAATVTIIVAHDLLVGVVVGVVLSAIKLLYLFSHIETTLDIYPKQGKAQLKLRGAATFIRLPQLAAELERVPAGTQLHVDFQNLDYIDHACLDLLMNWAKQHEATGGTLAIDWESLHARFQPEHVRRAADVPLALANNGQQQKADVSLAGSAVEAR